MNANNLAQGHTMNRTKSPETGPRLWKPDSQGSGLQIPGEGASQHKAPGQNETGLPPHAQHNHEPLDRRRKSHVRKIRLQGSGRQQSAMCSRGGFTVYDKMGKV